MRGAVLVMAGLAVWVCAPAAGAQGAQALQAASLAATCAACHGSEGRALPGAVLPGLAGMPTIELREKMLAFRDGTRPGSVMPQIAKGYSEAQIEHLADYFAHRPAVR